MAFAQRSLPSISLTLPEMDKPAVLLSNSHRVANEEMAFEAAGSPLPLEDTRRTLHLRPQSSFEFRCNFSLPDIVEEDHAASNTMTSSCTTLVDVNAASGEVHDCCSGFSVFFSHNVRLFMRKFERLRRHISVILSNDVDGPILPQ
ncbi:hypothetical protein BDQ12DRAFT_65517 [Crucibulum laeve]|uniref:Uncharacterized protein n=1 Tax=Crucibulum laeve TaxID=68775 RepID=A0A5C3LGH4_9AGAR|nr:hypothetical protein BDQ12DRAFT_65517 [Crucibulum laeve]